MTSSISSLKRKEPTSSSSRVMAREIRTGCGPEGSSPTITTVPPRTAPWMAEARPWWLPEDSITTSASTAAIASASSALQDLVGAHGRAISSGLACMSTATIRAAPARLRTATARAPMGPLPITSAVLPATSPARDTACQATLTPVRSAPRSAGPGPPAAAGASGPAGSRTG